ncbi:XRE family transcriptional regulator [Cnuibacter physcomitrellae]|uniref:helix-turn-helix domain-containing protein n=1 Tax=Cnuibacter physcomitrellae TaxID=1619308 RepID=UPI002175B8AF|nr:XRE family transcriptional regulator [Cnuibacter physcomitrellae]MCS5499418.1 XRE family transcriptional regulator [Cnuibacter physcomitrellae]
MTASTRRSTSPLDDDAVVMGERIRSVRHERGLTLVELAGLTGMSQPFLSLVERGHARLSLTSMARVSDALGIRQGALLAREATDREELDGVDVVHGDHRASPVAGSRRAWQLAQLPGGLFGTEMVGTERDGEFAAHAEEEFVYVLDGVLEVELDDGSVQTLRRGDSIAFASGRRHLWRAVDDDGYRVLTVTSPPGGP